MMKELLLVLEFDQVFVIWGFRNSRLQGLVMATFEFQEPMMKELLLVLQFDQVVVIWGFQNSRLQELVMAILESHEPVMKERPAMELALQVGHVLVVEVFRDSHPQELMIVISLFDQLVAKKLMLAILEFDQLVAKEHVLMILQFDQLVTKKLLLMILQFDQLVLVWAPWNCRPQKRTTTTLDREKTRVLSQTVMAARPGFSLQSFLFPVQRRVIMHQVPTQAVVMHMQPHSALMPSE
jgi:hypothetical protein